MEIRILGAVEVLADGRAVLIGGRKPRALLAALALTPGNVVSTSRLVDVVWGLDPPETATGLVQTYVSALRRQLSGFGDVIETRSPGYVLVADPDDIDHMRFQRLLEEARAARSAGADERAVELFGTALGLWRGPALGEFGESTLAAEAAGLNELRLLALEERTAAELALGRCEAAVGELTGVVRQYPAREMLRRHLMVALFALDRQADALAVFREGREVLIEEYGVEPGTALCAAHEAILRGDRSALGLRSQRSAQTPVRTVRHVGSSPARRPAQLPAVPGDFTGRHQQRAELSDGLSAEAAAKTVPVWVISGQGGVGKSTLALRAAHDLAAAYPDGQLFAPLHGTTGTPAATEAVLARLLSTLGFDQSDLPSTVEERAELYRSTLAGTRMLVVLDDAATEEQVRPLLPGSPGCGVMVTSRSRMAGLVGARLTELAVMTDAEAAELLTRIAGADRVEAEPQALRRLVHQSARLPLAVRIIGVRLATRRHWRLAQLSDRLDGEARRLDELSVGDQQVRASFGISYDALPGAAKVALRRLGGLGLPEFPAWVMGALLDAPQEAVEQAIDDLVDAHLLTFAGVDGCGQTRYLLHDLLRIFAAERAGAEDGAGPLAAAVARVVEGWVHLVDAITAGRPTGGLLLRDRPADRRTRLWLEPAIQAALAKPPTWFTVEHHALMASVERAAALGLDQPAGDLASALSASFAVGNMFDAWEQTNDVALVAARQAGNRRIEGVLLAELGQLRHKQDRMAESRTYLMQALHVFRELQDPRGEAATLAALATANHEQGYLSEALHFFGLAEPIFDELGDHAGVAYTRRLTGLVHLERGAFAEAQRQISTALDTFQRLGSRRGEGIALRTLSLLHRARGEYQRAYEVAEQARAIFQDTGDELLEAYSARSAAKALVRLGRGEEAGTLLDQALLTSRTLGDRWGEAMTLRNRGERDLADGRLPEAEEKLGAAIRLWRAIDLPLHQARTQRDLADVRSAAGDQAAAGRLRAEALEIFRLYGAREQAELTD